MHERRHMANIKSSNRAAYCSKRACIFSSCARWKAATVLPETAGASGRVPDAKLEPTEDGETMLLPVMQGGGGGFISS